MAEDLSPTLDEAARVDLFRTMVLIRRFEDAVLEAARCVLRPAGSEAGLLPGDLRLSAGREPVATGVCAHLDGSDALTAAHRPHHLAVAHGMDLRKLAVEALGPSGSDSDRRHRWHLFDPETDFTSSATIAEGYPPALGRAFAFQQRSTGRVAIAVTDKVAAHQDGFREALDLATLWSLPLVFVVEDDDWPQGSSRSMSYAASAKPSMDYGVYTERVEENAVESVFESAGRAVNRARLGEGPSVLEVHTVRLWRNRESELPEFVPGMIDVVGIDPVATYEQTLRDAGVLDDNRTEQINGEARDRVAEAIAFAQGQGDDPDHNGHCPTCEQKAAR